MWLYGFSVGRRSSGDACRLSLSLTVMVRNASSLARTVLLINCLCSIVSRIFLSPLIHSRFPLHLLFNMLVLGPLGSSLEAQYGSFTFAGILAVAAVGSSIVSLILQGTWLLLTGSSSVAYSCHVGFSGAIFAYALGTLQDSAMLLQRWIERVNCLSI